jgi:hypothetical protein
MFGTYPAREILMWIGGMLVAAAIAIFGVICLVDAYLAVHDPADALSIQRDLNQDRMAKESDGHPRIAVSSARADRSPGTDDR